MNLSPHENTIRKPRNQPLLSPIWLLLLTFALAGLLTRHTTGQPIPLPGPAAPPETPTHLLMVNFPEKIGGGSNHAAFAIRR